MKSTEINSSREVGDGILKSHQEKRGRSLCLFLIRTTIILFIWLISINTYSANFYWVGGSGNWSDISHWATTSGGGINHFVVPSAFDDVYFDANSFNGPGQVVTITDGGSKANVVCRNMNWTGALYEPIIAGNNTQTLRIYGSLTFIASMTNSFQGKVYFESIEQGNTITCAGKSFNNDVVFQGSGGWSLVDDFTCTCFLYFQSGSLRTAGRKVTCSQFVSSSGLSRYLSIENSTISVTTEYSSNNFYPWDVNGDNLILESEKSNIIFTRSSYLMFKHYNEAKVYNNIQYLAENTNYYSILSGGGSTFNVIKVGLTTSNPNYGNPGYFQILGSNVIDTLLIYSKGLDLGVYGSGGNNIINYLRVTYNSVVTGLQDIGTAYFRGDLHINGSSTFDSLDVLGYCLFEGTNAAGYCRLSGDAQFAQDTFDTLLLSSGRIYKFSAGKTLTINNLLSIPGSCTGSIILQSTESGNQANLFKSIGLVEGNYLSLRDINATGGAEFTANNSVDLGNNTGWTINTTTPLDLFWVGGTGNWDDPSHWAFSSGGLGGACLPTANDNVFFDGNSFTEPGESVTINIGNAVCKNLSWIGSLYSPTFSGGSMTAIHIYGSLTFIASMTNNFQGKVYFESIEQGNTITCAGKSFNNDVVFQGSGGWSLVDDFTCTCFLYFQSGSLRTAGRKVTCSQFVSSSGLSRYLSIENSTISVTTDYSSNNFYPWDVNGDNLILESEKSNIIFTRSSYLIFKHYNEPKVYNNIQYLAENTDYYSILSGGGSTFNVIKVGLTTSNPNYGNPGYFQILGSNVIDTLLIYSKGLDLGVYGSGGNNIINYLRVTYNSEVTGLQDIGTAYFRGDLHINGSSTFDSLDVLGYCLFEGINAAGYCRLSGDAQFAQDTFDTLLLSSGRIYKFSAGKTLTINNLLSIPGSCTGSIILQSTESGNQANLFKSIGLVEGNYLSLRDINAIGGAEFTANNSVDLGNNTGWTINTTSPLDLFWVGGTGNWDDPSHWAFSSGGLGGACLPTANDNVFFDGNSFTEPGQSVTINIGNAVCKNLSWIGSLYSPTFSGGSMTALHIYGSLTFIASMTNSFQGKVYFESIEQGNTITCAGKSFNNDVVFQGSGGWSLVDDFTCTCFLYFQSGSLRTAGRKVTCSQFVSSSGLSRYLSIENSTISVTTDYSSNNFYPWDVNGDNLILESEKSNIIFTRSSYLIFKHYNEPKVYNNIQYLAENTDYYSILSGGGSTFNVIKVGLTTSNPNYGNPGYFQILGSNVIDTLLIYSKGLDLGVYGSGGNNIINYLRVTYNSEVTGLQDIGTAYFRGDLHINGSSTFDSLDVLGYCLFEGINAAGYCRLSGDAQFAQDTFDTLILSPGHLYQIKSSKQLTVNNHIGIRGNNCFPIQLRSTVQGQQVTLWKPDGAVSGDFLELRDINATGGALFYAGSYSTDLGNNTGWLFNNSPGYVYGLGPDTTLCSGQTLSTINFNGAYSYLWQDGSTQPYYTITQPGVYWVVATYATNCSYRDTINVDVKPSPTAGISGSNLWICSGGEIQLQGQVTGGLEPYHFSWWPSLGLSDTAVINPIANPLTTTSYVFQTVGANDCVSTDTVIVQVASPITVGLSSTPPTVCGTATGTATASVLGGLPFQVGSAYQYSWSTNPPQNTSSISNLVAGSYYVDVLDSLGCTGSASIVLSDPGALPVTLVLSNDTVCLNQTLIATASGADQYEFFVDGISQGGATSNSYFIVNGLIPGVHYIAVAGTTSGCTGSSSIEVVRVFGGLDAQIIINSSSIGSVCPGESITFTSSLTNGGTIPSLQWFVNGTEVLGATSPIFTAVFQDQDVVKCRMISNAPCVNPAEVWSNEIGVSVVANQISSVSIVASPGTNICLGDAVILTANPINGGSAPVYQWFLNNSLVAVGSNSYIINNPSSGDVVYCQLISNISCGTGAPVISNSLIFNSIPTVELGVIITSSSQAVCVGSNVEFIAMVTNGSQLVNYQWKVNGIEMGQNMNQFNYIPSDYDEVICVVTDSLSTCVINNPAISNPIAIRVGATPAPKQIKHN